MSSIKPVNGYLHHVYYDPAIKNNRTKSLHLKDNAVGRKQAKQHLRHYEAQKALGIDIYAQEKPVENSPSDYRLSDLPEKYVPKRKITSGSDGLNRYAISKLIEAIGDIFIWQVEERHNVIFMDYLDTIRRTTHTSKRNSDGTYEVITKATNEPIAHNTKAGITGHIETLFTFAKEKGWIKANPFKAIDPEKKRPKRVPIDHLVRILNFHKAKKDPEHFYVILFMLITGYRLSSVCALTWDMIDFESKVIDTPNVKGHRQDPFPMVELLCKILEKQKERDLGYPNNKVWRYKQRSSFGFWNTAFKKVFIQEAKEGKQLPHYTPHQCRKTFASILRNNGMQIDDVAFLIGHKDKATTEAFYLDLKLERLSSEMDKAFTQEFGDIF